MMPYSQILNYVMAFHSHNSSPCFLNYDRKIKKFSMISFTELFKKHDNNIVERLIMPEPHELKDGDIQTTPNIKFTPTDKVFGTDGHGNDSTIIEYSTESPTALYGVNFFANQSISGFSRNSSTFNYNLKTLSKDEYTKKYYELFVDPFRKMFEKDDKDENHSYKLLPNFYMSKPGKTDSKSKNWTQVDGALPTAITEQQFMNQKLFSLLFLNQTYTFKLPGITRRKCGTFVDLYRETLQPKEQPSNWDYNTLGRHLITCVKHTFTHDTYINHVETVKPYRITTKVLKRLGASDWEDMSNNYGY